MKVGAVIVAAGEGKRMGEGKEKLFIQLEGVPLLAITLTAFQNCPEVKEIVLVANRRVKERFETEIRGSYDLSKVVKLVEGGPRRQDSVYNGLLAFTVAPEIVLIHDGDRPFADSALIRAVVEKSGEGGAIPAVRVRDTVKWAERGQILKTLERNSIWLAQTPQCFPYPDILAAHQKAREEGREVTDDATLIELSGNKVKIVEGSYDNIKVTTPGDWELAKVIYAKRRALKEV